MKPILTLMALFVVAFALGVSTVVAADANPPERLSYQGYLTDANGAALGNTNTGPKNYDVIFRIWNDQSSTDVNKRLWTEQQTVTVDKGYFSVLLGEGSQYNSEPRPVISTVFTNADVSDRYVEMTVKGIGAGTPPADVTILPRLRLLTSPYAFLARNISDGSVTPTKLAGNVGLWTKSGSSIYYNDGNVGVGTASPDVKLKVNGTLGINSGFDGMGAIYSNRGLMGGGVEIGYDNPNGIGNLACVSESVAWKQMRYTAASHAFCIAGAGDVMSITPGGIGLGTGTPHAQLSLGTSLANTKLALFDDGVNNYGLGIQGGQFRLHLGWPQARFSFLASADGAELMTIKADGKVGIGTASPGMALDVNGDARAGHVQAVGANPSFGAFRNGSAFEIGLADGGGAYSTDAAAGDTVFRTMVGKKMLLQNDSGGSAMCVSGNSVGFGTTAPATKVHIRGVNFGQLLLTSAESGTSWHVFSQSDTSFMLYSPFGAYAWCNGVNGAWGASSDIKLKEDVADLEGVLDKVKKMRPVSYRFKAAPKNTPRSFGFIAQDVETLFPEIVQDNGQELGKGIYYQELVPVAIAAVQELNAQVEESNKASAAKIAALEKEVADLKDAVNKLMEKNGGK